jgi:hypothetical protein
LSALEDAILFLQKQNPLPPFSLSHGLSLAAEELVKMNGPLGIIGFFMTLQHSLFEEFALNVAEDLNGTCFYRTHSSRWKFIE